MAAREDWLLNQISKLQVEDSRILTLTAIKEYFGAIPRDEAKFIANNLELAPVFDCLNDSNSEQIELACDVLTSCMENLSLGDSTSRYSVLLERALNHPHSSVKIMALLEVERSVENETLITNLSNQASLINSVIKNIGDDNLGVAKLASKIISRIGISSSGIEVLLSVNCLRVIYNVMGISEIVRLRVNEVFIDISKASESSMVALQSAGLFSPMFKDLDDNDILLKMNIIQLLSDLVTTTHGYTFLESQGVIKKILSNFEDENLLASMLCEPGIIKFFGHMAQRKPTEIISKYHMVLDKIFYNILGTDLTLIKVSLETLGYIAETNEGKIALDSTGNKIIEVLRVISMNMLSYPTDLRIRALNCLENLFRINEFDNKISVLVKKWYYSLGDNPFDWIYKFAQNPFSELRIAGLSVLSALATHSWGQECFKNTPGFIEFLLDRRIETTKECKELKYEIVKMLSASQVFDHSTQLQLQAFVKEGPFYVQAITEVAVEGED